jgi:hypothetical protein
VLVFLGLDPRCDAPRWPPDAFAAAVLLLQRSDSYRLAVERWPPGNRPDWVKFIEEVGRVWRAASTRSETPLPRDVVEWWGTLVAAGEAEIASLGQRRPLVEACLQLLAAADEASSGVGVLDPEKPQDDFDQRAMTLLAMDRPAATLCAQIDPSRALVLPKMHTPQVGMSIRSLSHHLAYCDAGEVAPRWDVAPRALGTRSLNLLLLPWPLEVVPRQFRENPGNLENMDPDSFSLFTCEMPQRADLDRVRGLVAKAERIVGRVDALVFPELALPPDDAVRLAKELQRVVIGGEGAPADPHTRSAGLNAAVVAVPLGPDAVLATRQQKHHRWRLDARQIGQYGLGSQLHPEHAWWEYINLGPRQLRFWCLDSWLAFCVLICEDLARQDPVAPVVRAVGPNLVITLVMDGPQLAGRWTARYATVLAEDPGASVLSLTSAGMVRLSQVPGKEPSRVVALWKDGHGGSPREIELETGAEAIVLCLTREMRTEWSADGRSDEEAAGCLLLNGVHQVHPDGAPPAPGP